MILKKRYKKKLQSWIEGMQLVKDEWGWKELVASEVWEKNYGYYIYYIPANSLGRQYLFGKSITYHRIYYYKISAQLILNIFLENGLKVRLENLQ